MARNPARRLAFPRRTLRLELALLYTGVFFVSGVVLLAIPGVALTSSRQSVPVGSPERAPAAAQHLRDVHRLALGSAVAFLVLVLLSLVLGWLIAGRLLRPLHTITATAREISASNLHRRLSLDGRPDEFRELADTLDDLFGRLQASFESQRRFVANASHELRTPLTAQRAVLQVALADPDADAGTLRSAVHEVLALGEQQEALIAALLTLASSERGLERREPLDLADVAGRVLDARRPEAARRGLRLEAALLPAATAGDPHLLASLAANLLDNALRHNAPGGRVEVSTAATASGARLSVRNTGPVIPAGELARLFQPFQQLGRQRISTRGHGLGLPIVQAIAAAHGAVLTVRPPPGGGLDVEVLFPSSGPEPVRGEAIRLRTTDGEDQ